MMEKKVTKLSNIYYLLFFVAYGLFLFASIIESSFFISKFPTYFIKLSMIICCMVLFLSEVICKKTTIKEVLFLLLCLSLSIIVFIHINKVTMIPFFLLIYSSRKIDFKKIVKFTVIETSLIFFVICLSSRLGIIMNYVDYSNGRIREYLGFRYSLFSSMYLFNIICMATYLINEKFNKKKNLTSMALVIIIHVLLALLNDYIYSYTNSRLSYYLALIVIIVSIVNCFKSNILKKRIIIQNLMVYSFIICAIVSIFMITNYNSENEYHNYLNDFLGNRLYLGKSSLSLYPINLFGHNTEFVGNGLDGYGNKPILAYNYVDCLYLNITEKYGIVLCAMLLLMITKSLINLKKKQEFFLMFILAIFALHGVIDDLEIYINYNVFWFIIGQYLIKKNN